MLHLEEDVVHKHQQFSHRPTSIHLIYSQDEGFHASRNEMGVGGGAGNEAMDCA